MAAGLLEGVVDGLGEEDEDIDYEDADDEVESEESLLISLLASGDCLFDWPSALAVAELIFILIVLNEVP